MRRAVFLDRDGVIVPDHGVDGSALPPPFPGAADALRRLGEHGWLRVVVTNQPVVARGVCTEDAVHEAHVRLDDELRSAGGAIDAFEVCFHHPEATLAQYRGDCDCRKPRAGLLLRAAARLDIDLPSSVLVGDRVTDIEAAARAGCRAVQVRSGRHEDARISSPEEPMAVTPEALVDSIVEAVDWILATS